MAKTVYKKKVKNGKEYYFYRLRHENLKKPKDIYAKTVKEMNEKIKNITYELNNDIKDNKEMFITFFTNWLFDVKFPELKLSTVELYDSIYRNYIKNNSLLSKLKIKDITLMDIQEYYNSLIAEGHSAYRIKCINKLISPCIRYAYNNNIILKDFTGGIVLPKETEKTKLERRNTIHPFTLEEQKKFITAIKGHDLEMLFITALYTGLRQGELFALTWSDVDLKEGSLYVNKTAKTISDITKNGRSPERLVIQTPKTKNSIRKVNLPSFLIPMLKNYKAQQKLQKIKVANLYQDNNLVFCNPMGKYLNDSTVRKKFKKVLKDNNLPDRKFHDLRHTYATRLFELGEAPKTVQELLGHSNVSQTLNTYTHVLEQLKKKTANKLNDLYLTM